MMSRAFSIRLGDDLTHSLADVAGVLQIKQSELIRQMLEAQIEITLASEAFHAKLAERQAALERLNAYAPEVEQDDPQAVAPMVPENGAGPDLSALVE